MPRGGVAPVSHSVPTHQLGGVESR